MSAKNWCFTLNNYTKDEESYLYAHPEYIGYMIVGHEVAPDTGTPHLQGYIQLADKKSMLWIKKHLCARMHLEKARGDALSNQTYCKKANDYKEVGTLSIAGSNRNQIYDEIQACKTWHEVLQVEKVEKHLAYAREVFQAKPLVRMPELQPRAWQKKILDIISTTPDDRTINWVYDKTGGAGKTYLCKYLVSNHNAFYFSPAKSQDVLYAYNNELIVLYDIPRSCDEQYLNYGCIEKLKDGIYFSGKYQSSKKVRTENCHIFIFSNSEPDREKFSEDRLNVIIPNYKELRML